MPHFFVTFTRRKITNATMMKVITATKRARFAWWLKKEGYSEDTILT